MAGYVREIKAYRPQLLTMEEAITPDVEQLRSEGALANLPHTFEIKRYDSRAFLVASKYPLVGTHVVYYDYLPLIVQTNIQLPSGEQPLWVVHTVAPLSVSFEQWKGEVAFIGRLVRARGPANLLVVGDFNSTWGNKGFRQILAAGMTDGAAARARPFEMTWSQTKPIIPPVVRIDHVLTGPGVAVTTISTEEGPGSDHRDVQATVAFRR
jgi:endonuclease/exonuclease/phosphatase family metal-dependent hydrolase